MILKVACIFLVILFYLDKVVYGFGKHLTKKEQMNFFEKYRYMGQNSPILAQRILSQRNPETAFQESVKMFQGKFGLKVTGTIDEETEHLMQKPRCGLADINDNDGIWSVRTSNIRPRWNMHLRQKRYKHLPGKGWNKKDIYYKITSYTSNVNKAEVDDVFRNASRLWNSVANVNVIPTENDPDIEIIFASGSHGDPFPFDGPGRTLAHTFYPKYGGDIHFDDSEDWTLYRDEGIYLFQIAVHELGHALGLDHSDYVDSVLYAFYFYKDNVKLHIDDIQGIQSLYGIRESKTVSTTQTATTKKATTTKPTTTTPKPTTTSTTTPKPTTTTTTPKPTTTTTPKPITTSTTTPKPTTTTTTPKPTTTTTPKPTTTSTTTSKPTTTTTTPKPTTTTTTTPKPTTTTTTPKPTTTTQKPTTTTKTTPKPTTTRTTSTPMPTTTTEKITTTTKTITEEEISCPVEFDAITMDRYGHLNIFQGDTHIQLQRESGGYKLAPFFPKRLQDSYTGLPSDLNAAAFLPELEEVTCTRTFFFMKCDKTGKVLDKAKTYFFKGNSYYLYDNTKQLTSGLISDKFPGVPSNLEATFTLDGQNMFFIKGQEYWKTSRTSTDVDGPRELSEFRGIPDALHDALHLMMFYNDINHHINIFFTKNVYYRISDGAYKVDSSPIYPQSTADFLGCENGKLKSAGVSKRSITFNQESIISDYKIFIDQDGQVIDSNFITAQNHKHMDYMSGGNGLNICHIAIIFCVTFSFVY